MIAKNEPFSGSGDSSCAQLLPPSVLRKTCPASPAIYIRSPCPTIALRWLRSGLSKRSATLFQVAPPSCVVIISPKAPTAKPVCASRNQTSINGFATVLTNAAFASDNSDSISAILSSNSDTIASTCSCALSAASTSDSAISLSVSPLSSAALFALSALLVAVASDASIPSSWSSAAFLLTSNSFSFASNTGMLSAFNFRVNFKPSNWIVHTLPPSVVCNTKPS